MSRGKIEYAGSAADFAHNRTEIEHLYFGGVVDHDHLDPAFVGDIIGGPRSRPIAMMV